MSRRAEYKLRMRKELSAIVGTELTIKQSEALNSLKGQPDLLKALFTEAQETGSTGPAALKRLKEEMQSDVSPVVSPTVAQCSGELDRSQKVEIAIKVINSLPDVYSWAGSSGDRGKMKLAIKLFRALCAMCSRDRELELAISELKEKLMKGD